MSRADKRTEEELRPIELEKGLCVSAQGSSRLKIGKTEVIVSIVGPKEMRFREIETGKVLIKAKSFPENHTINDIVTTAIENSLDCTKYPDSTLEVLITIISDDGSLKCCAINAAIMALDDAGLSLRSKVSASSISIMENTDEDGDISYSYFADPSLREEEISTGIVTFAYEQESNIVFATFFDGCVPVNQIADALKMATFHKDQWAQFFTQ